jgi:hypothetical protein
MGVYLLCPDTVGMRTAKFADAALALMIRHHYRTIGKAVGRWAGKLPMAELSSRIAGNF